MKPLQIALLFLLLSVSNILAQDKKILTEGEVSYLSSQNIYVKFETTANMKVGDTLFVAGATGWVPAMVITQLSSISCVGVPVGKKPLVVKSRLTHIVKPAAKSALEPVVADDVNRSAPAAVTDEFVESFSKPKAKKSKPAFDGRVSLSSYSNISDYGSNQRYRYNLSLNTQNLNGSRFSGESYITFTHKSNEWKEIGKNVFQALKIYTLAVKYDIDKSSGLWLGRRINVNMANVGAVDGLQYEKKAGNFTFGAVAGSRPDYFDYGFNPNLLQYGAYVGHSVSKENGTMQSSVAFFNQTNKGHTDRRFGYVQHSNSLAKNLDFFGSAEFDLYTLKNVAPTGTAADMQPASTFELTSTYLSLRYRPWRKLSLSLSYDARKNIYYYETFRNTIDSILDKEMRQGARFQFNYRPLKYISWGGNAGYRYQKSDASPSMNASSYINYAQLPIIHTSATIDATWLKSAYLNGMVYGISLSQDAIPGVLSTDVECRLVDYQYTNSPSTLRQWIGEVGLTWRIAKKLSLSSDFELTFEKENTYGRVYLNLTQRF